MLSVGHVIQTEDGWIVVSMFGEVVLEGHT